MKSGYCHEFPTIFTPADEMDCSVYAPTGHEIFVHYRDIDGSPHAVFWCPDRLYRAQTCVHLGRHPQNGTTVHRIG